MSDAHNEKSRLEWSLDRSGGFIATRCWVFRLRWVARRWAALAGLVT
jgi:hypothetical protein